MVGEAVDLTYDYDHLGDTVSTLEDLINGKHEYSAKLMSAQRPMIVLGSEALQREDGTAIQRLAQELSAKLKAASEDPTWKIFNVLHKNASQVAAMDLGYKTGLKAIAE